MAFVILQQSYFTSTKCVCHANAEFSHFKELQFSHEVETALLTPPKK